jgi:transposase InsO family protein
MAYLRRKPEQGLLHHSDRGSQYACHEYQKRLRQHGMSVSMSRKGNCWDNAPVERFFRSLKSERLASCWFATRKSAEIEVLDYIPPWDIRVPWSMRKKDFKSGLTVCPFLLDHYSQTQTYITVSGGAVFMPACHPNKDGVDFLKQLK